jgi:DNA-binding response OmpR family regulator
MEKIVTPRDNAGIASLSNAHSSRVDVVMGRTREIDTSKASAHHPAPGTFRYDVLVVDDDADMVTLLLWYFSAKNLTTRGLTYSMDYLKEIQEINPRVVVLDVVMPGMNGYDLCASIKASRRLRGTKVVIVSGRPQDDISAGAARCGADGFIAKPFDLVVLDGVIERLFVSEHPPAVQVATRVPDQSSKPNLGRR